LGITLEDSQGKSISVNAWNWGVLHFTVTCARPKFLKDDFLGNLRFGGVSLSEDQSATLLNFLEEVVLPRLKPGQRMFYDLSVTDEPDDGTLHRDNLEKNYSLHHSVLVSVIEFLRNAQPPINVS
jgi:hypothetical protein